MLIKARWQPLKSLTSLWLIGFTAQLCLASTEFTNLQSIPQNWTLIWLLEIARDISNSNVFKPTRVEEWSLSIETQQGTLCARRHSKGEDQFLIAENLPLAALSLPGADVVLPFMLPKDAWWDHLPTVGLDIAMKARASIPLEARSGALDAQAKIASESPRDDLPPLAARHTTLNQQDSGFMRRVDYAAIAPGELLPRQIDVFEHDGLRTGFYRWRLVSSRIDPVAVHAAPRPLSESGTESHR